MTVPLERNLDAGRTVDRLRCDQHRTDAYGGPWPGRIALVTMPALVFGIVALTYGRGLTEGFADSFKYVHDAHTNLFVVSERAAALKGDQPLFDAKWFHPYPHAAAFMEHLIFSGGLYGLLKAAGFGEASAYNVAALLLLVLNYLASELLLKELLGRRLFSVPLAMMAAFSPYCWARYYAPLNTAFFPSVLALVVLRRACVRPSWTTGLGAPLLVALQFWTAMYVGMFAVILAVFVVPATLLLVPDRVQLRRMAVRLGAGLVAALVALVPIWRAYDGPMRTLHPGESYEYVSAYQSMTFATLWAPAPLDCRLRLLGKERTPTECAEENFIGWPLAILGLATVLGLFAGWLNRLRIRARMRELTDPSFVVPVVTIAAAAGLCLVVGATWPWHLGMLGLLLRRRSDGRPATSFALHLVELGLLVYDVALNPAISLPWGELRSSYALFHRYVPGMSGIRSEYRIVVFLPLIVAILVGVYWRRLATSWPLRSRRWAAAVLLAVTLPSSLPAWQGFVPALPDRGSPTMQAASALPGGAILAVMLAKGTALARPNDAAQARLDSYIVVHGHRTVTGYSGYVSPAAKALVAAAALPDERQRVVQSVRLARLFGATHMLVGWLDERAPAEDRIVEAAAGSIRTVARDEHFALFELVPNAVGAGLAPSPGASPGSHLLDANVTTSFTRAASTDSASTARHVSSGAQQAGEWVEARFKGTRRVDAVVFSPGLEVESIPHQFVVEARVGGVWREVASSRSLALPDELIRHPLSGVFRVPLSQIDADTVRLRLVEGSPFRWSLANFGAEGKP